MNKKAKIALISALVIVGTLIISLAIAAQGGKKKDSCSDSDSGNNYFVQGTVSGYQDHKPYSYTDYCVDSNVLKEYWCSGISPQSYNEDCSQIPSNTTTYICQNGACVPT